MTSSEIHLKTPLGFSTQRTLFGNENKANDHAQQFIVR